MRLTPVIYIYDMQDGPIKTHGALMLHAKGNNQQGTGRIECCQQCTILLAQLSSKLRPGPI